VTRKETSALGADLVIPALALAFAAYFFVSIAELGWEAKANGVLVGSILVILVCVQLARVGLQLVRGTGALGFGPLLAPRDALGKRVALVVIAAAFIGLMRWLGLTLDLFLAMAAALRVLGVRGRGALLWTPLVCAAAAYVMFIAVLNAEFPRGPIEQLLALLR
jgi:hypothetical protein